MDTSSIAKRIKTEKEQPENNDKVNVYLFMYHNEILTTITKVYETTYNFKDINNVCISLPVMRRLIDNSLIIIIANCNSNYNYWSTKKTLKQYSKKEQFQISTNPEIVKLVMSGYDRTINHINILGRIYADYIKIFEIGKELVDNFTPSIEDGLKMSFVPYGHEFTIVEGEKVIIYSQDKFNVA